MHDLLVQGIKTIIAMNLTVGRNDQGFVPYSMAQINARFRECKGEIDCVAIEVGEEWENADGDLHEIINECLEDYNIYEIDSSGTPFIPDCEANGTEADVDAVYDQPYYIRCIILR